MMSAKARAEGAIEAIKLIKFHLAHDNPGEAMETLESYAAEARNEALEEAAKMVDSLDQFNFEFIGDRIRALKSPGGK